ncbi:hypothetical protein ACOMHN_036697 [Nucella lapillus]
MDTEGRNKKERRNRHFRRRPAPSPESCQVVNLSTEAITRVLSPGLKFCPTPRTYNELKLLGDVMEGNRHLRLKEFFFDDNTPNQLPTRPQFYKRTMWQPPKDRDQALETYCFES